MVLTWVAILLIIAAFIVILILSAGGVHTANGPKMIRAIHAERFSRTSVKEDISTLKPKDLLEYLETGDQSSEDLKFALGYTAISGQPAINAQQAAMQNMHMNRIGVFASSLAMGIYPAWPEYSRSVRTNGDFANLQFGPQNQGRQDDGNER